MPSRTRRRPDIRDERGAVIILAAVMMVMLMGFVGLALDSGGLFNHKRILQTAADAGAWQGGYELHRGNTGLVTSAAMTGSLENGAPHGTDGAVVEVYHPPVAGYYVGNPAAVEVVVRQPTPITFMSLFGWGAAPNAARAVVLTGLNSDTCIHVLEPWEQDAFDYQSSAVLNAPDCGLMVESRDPWGGHLTSNSYVRVEDASFGGVPGPGFIEESSSDLVLDPGIPDPLGEAPYYGDLLCPPGGATCMTPPVVGGCDHTDWEIDQPSITLTPGVYCGKFTLKNATQASVDPGVYIMAGGPMKIEGDSKLGPVNIVNPTDGVVFYFTEWGGNFEPFSISSNAQVDLTASSDPADPYYQILFYVDPLAGDGTEEFTFESNTGTHYLNGTVYMPGHVFNVESSSVIESGCDGGCADGSDYLLIIVRRFIAESNSVINMRTNYPAGASILETLRMVE